MTFDEWWDSDDSDDALTVKEFARLAFEAGRAHRRVADHILEDLLDRRGIRHERVWPEARADGAPVTCLRCGKRPVQVGVMLAVWCAKCCNEIPSHFIWRADAEAWWAHRRALAASPPAPDPRDELLERAALLMRDMRADERFENAVGTAVYDDAGHWLLDWRALRGRRP